MQAVRRSSRRRSVWLGLIAGLCAFAIPTSSASADPWTCDAFGYLTQSAQVQQIDLATGEDTNIGSLAVGVNAVGYNVLDDFMYAYAPGTEELVRIHDDLTHEVVTTDLPAPSTVGAGQYHTGDIDDQGHYWVTHTETAAGTHTWFEVDLEPGSTTYGDVLSTNTATVPAGMGTAPDWAWINGVLYAVTQNPVTNEAHLASFNPAANTWTDHGGLGFNTAAGVGAVYTDADGYLYGSDNASGRIHRIDPATGQSLLISNGPASASNDGARCANAAIPTITVSKLVDGRVRPADQFTVGLDDDGGATLTSATTSGNNTTVSTTNWPVSQNATYTITDAMGPGSGSPLSDYVISIACTDGGGNPVATGGTPPNWTLLVADATDYTCVVTNTAEADLELVKTAPQEADAHRRITWRLVVTNNGPSSSVGANLTDSIPDGIRAPATPTAGCAIANRQLDCTLGDLAPGASTTVILRGRTSRKTGTCYRNDAAVTDDVTDPDLTNNNSRTATCVRKPNLKLNKRVSKDVVRPGEVLAYRVRVRNVGKASAFRVPVCDAMPRDLFLVRAPGASRTTAHKACWRIKRLQPGARRTFRVVARVSPGADPGRLVNRANTRGDRDRADVRVVTPGPCISWNVRASC